MCGNIRPLFNFEPPSSTEEIHNATLQVVRKISGHPKPSRINQEVFDAAVLEIAAAAQTLIDGLTTNSAPKNREDEIAKRRAKNAKRFAKNEPALHIK